MKDHIYGGVLKDQTFPNIVSPLTTTPPQQLAWPKGKDKKPLAMSLRAGVSWDDFNQPFGPFNVVRVVKKFFSLIFLT